MGYLVLRGNRIVLPQKLQARSDTFVYCGNQTASQNQALVAWHGQSSWEILQGVSRMSNCSQTWPAWSTENHITTRRSLAGCGNRSTRTTTNQSFHTCVSRLLQSLLWVWCSDLYNCRENHRQCSEHDISTAQNILRSESPSTLRWGNWTRFDIETDRVFLLDEQRSINIPWNRICPNGRLWSNCKEAIK